MVTINYKKNISIESEEDFAKIKNSILTILENNELLTLSTVNLNSPHVCSAYYVFDEDFNLYIWTEMDTTHSKNVEKNGNVAVNIADTGQKWGSKLQGLQIKGKCYPLSIAKMIKPAKLYFKRFPLVKKFIKNPRDFNTKFDSKMYKIEISWIKLFDEKAFGKEVWKEISIVRK